MSVGRAIPLAIGIALGAGALLFAALNRHVVDIDFYFFRLIELPLWTIVLVSLMLGWAVPRLFRIRVWFKHARERSQLKKRIRGLEKEVVELRNIPLDLEADLEDEPTVKPVLVRRAPMEDLAFEPDEAEVDSDPYARPAVRGALPAPEEVETELLTEP